MRLILFLCLVLTTPALLTAQVDKQEYDSLMTVLPSLPNDTAKAKVLSLLGLSARKFDPEQSKQHAEALLDLSAQINYPAGEGKAYNILGLLKYYEGSLDEALAYQWKAHEAYQLANDKGQLAANYNDIANLHADKGELSTAIEYYMEGLEMSEAVGDTVQQIKFLGNIGSIFHEQKDYANALKYYFNTLDAVAKIEGGNAQIEMIVTSNVAEIYKDQGKLDESLTYYRRSLAIRQGMGYKRGVGMVKASLGEVLYMAGDTAEARQELEEGIAILREVKDRYSLGMALGTLGEIAMAEKRYTDAITYFEEAMEVAEQVEALQFLRDAAQSLAEANEAVGQYQAALSYQKLYGTYKDSILNLETNGVIAELQTKYETKEKEQQIVSQAELLLEQRRRISLQLVIFIISVVFIVLVAGLLINRNKLKQAAKLEKTIADEQKIRFRAVIEAQEQERKRIAQELHDGLGQLLSTARLNVSGLEDEVDKADPDSARMFKNSLDLIDESVQEVRNISHNMMPSALIRLGLVPALREQINKINQAGGVQVSLNTDGLDGRLNEGLEISLYRIVQEVLNNTLKHADARLITVTLRKLAGEVQLSITDDGKGMDKEVIKHSSGIGWKNIYSRVEMMNGTMAVESTPGKGTSVQVSVVAA